MWPFTSSNYTEVKQVSNEMIEDYLRRRNLKFLRDQDGAYVLLLRVDEKMPGVTLTVFLKGGQQTYAMAAVLPVAMIRTASHPLQVVNDWNREKACPRAYYDNEGNYILDLQLFLAPGITQALFDHISDWFFAGVGFFAQELYAKSQ
jgi:hypothetical protein